MAKSFDDLILPNAFIGFGIGMVDSSMMPTLAYLVDIRHTSIYGSVFALGDIAFCASFVFGNAITDSSVCTVALFFSSLSLSLTFMKPSTFFSSCYSNLSRG